MAKRTYDRARSRYPVPCAPILRIVDRWLEAYGRETGITHEYIREAALHKRVLPLTGHAVLAQRCGFTSRSMTRTMYRLRRESSHMRLSQADKLLQATYGAHLWEEDPELRAIMARIMELHEGEGLLSEAELEEWAAAAVGAMTERDRAAVVAGVALFDLDGSTAAQHRRRAA